VANIEISYVISEGLSFAYWKGEQSGVVFNRYSGDTHLINLMTLYVLQNIMQSPTSSTQVSEALAQAFDLECDEELERQVKHLLLQLSRQNLIRHQT